MARTPLTSRPLDLLYFIFFLMHIPATLIIDAQGIYPPSLVPSFLKQIIPFYINMSGDPLISALNGWYPGSEYTYAWFRSFVWVEILCQLPLFIYGAHALYHNSPKIYIPLIIYGSSTATTTLACIATVLAAPSTTSLEVAYKTNAVTDVQRVMLLASYVPFMLVPLGMAVDMAGRVAGMVDWKGKGKGKVE